MAVPSVRELMLPLLKYAAQKGDETSIAELYEEIASEFHLSDIDLKQLLPSGGQTVFSNRLNWAKSYISKAGLLERTKRGYFRITDRGRNFLSENPDNLNVALLKQYPEFTAWISATGDLRESSSSNTAELNQDVNPEEQISINFDYVTQELSKELIQRVHNFTPSFFERLIVDLLLKMGYGGGRMEMGRALGKAGDGGVDGVIKEDELGLDVVYVQAKRYAPDNAVPVREVRDFIGSLEGHRASKGVFVTTSYFPDSAREFVGRVSKRVILIDGSELTKLMIRHNVGVRIKDTYEVKKIDEDYFAE